ncbi:MAG: hypothetical protein VYE59_03595 [Candidatus Thermoplasmatota archaeon]|nr:hypothetical protein [Candidatus Thermoplasmatota archaeon]
MKDVIDLIMDAYRFHLNKNLKKRNSILKIVNTTNENKNKWIDFFEKIEYEGMSIEEKEKLLENVLREKYKIF